ncbi:hypothetical protein L4C38_04075 [Vibrio kasasachensis]|uniref:hypothetical protein n=1 Tax=Vibrio kasasachensis TaxID=2910248 RepID=UPI003D118983
MKRFSVVSISILVILLGSYISFGLYRQSLLSTNIEHGNYKRCFNDSNLISQSSNSWDSAETFDVQFVAAGNEHCFAPNFPSIQVSSENVTHWLHIVTTSGDAAFSGKHSSFGSNQRNWTFVDVGSQEQRNNSVPFYSVGSVFEDNPGWSAAPHLSLNWSGKVFGLVEKDGEFYPMGGFSWGFDLKRWTFLPQAIYPEPLSKQDWFAIVDTLNEEYPSYKFN